jgi:hypothetical protein
MQDTLCVLEGRQESQSRSDGMKAITRPHFPAPAELADFIQRHRVFVLTGPVWLSVATIILRSVSQDFRAVTDFIFPPR